MKILRLIFHNKDRRKKFFYLVVCLFSISAVTFAWFYSAKTTSTGNIELVSVESVDMMVSLDGISFFYNIQLPLPDSLEFEPVSGSGKDNLMFMPILPRDSDNAEDAVEWQQKSYDSSDESNCFYYFPLYFKADKPGYVALSSVNAAPAAVAEDRQSEDYTDKNGDEISSSGEVTRSIEASPLYSFVSGTTMITKDYIAGAARVGLVNKTNSSESGVLQDALIITNDTYKLSCIVDDGKCSCTMQENAESDSSGGYYNGEAIIDYGDSDLNVITESRINGGERLSVLELVENSDGEYEGQIDVCLWIEGTDNEANEILSGGRMLFDLTFSYSDELS